MKDSEKIIISCDLCEAAIINGTASKDPAIQSHLAECAVCREFARFQAELLTLEPVIKTDMPTFESIKRKAVQRKCNKSKIMRLVVMPLSMAAAVAVTVSVIIFDAHFAGHTDTGTENIQPGSKLPAVAGSEYAAPVLANVSVQTPDSYMDYQDESDAFTAALEENFTALAWDQASAYAQNCSSSMQAVRNSEQWSIEVLNFYNEDLLW